MAEESKGKQLNISQRMVSASFGAILTSLLVTPFDVIKTKQQTVSPESFNSTFTSSTQNVYQKRLNNLRSTPLHDFKFYSNFLNIKCKPFCKNRLSSANNINRSVNLSSNQSLLTSFSSFRCSGSLCLKKNVFTIKSSLLSPTLALKPTIVPRVGLIQAFNSILKQEGLRGLYVGLKPTLLMSIPQTVLYFSAYDHLQDSFKKNSNFTTTQVAFLAGSLGRIFAAFSVSPFELLKIRLQATRGQASKLPMMSQFSQILRNEGFLSIFRGILPTLLRDVPFSAIYWTAVEKIRIKLAQEYDVENEITRSFVAGSGGGFLATIFTMPFDVIKTRAQVLTEKRSSMTQISRLIFKEEGVKGLFSGLVPRLIRVVPACAIMLTSFEAAKQVFSN